MVISACEFKASLGNIRRPSLKNKCICVTSIKWFISLCSAIFQIIHAEAFEVTCIKPQTWHCLLSDKFVHGLWLVGWTERSRQLARVC